MKINHVVFESRGNGSFCSFMAGRCACNDLTRLIGALCVREGGVELFGVGGLGLEACSC